VAKNTFRPANVNFDSEAGKTLRCGRAQPFFAKEMDKPVGLSICFAKLLDCALNLVRAEASCADVNMARSTVNDRLDTLDVGLPCTVGSSVRMGDLNAERNALAADIALCHQLHLLAIGKSGPDALKAPTNIIAELFPKCKYKFQEK